MSKHEALVVSIPEINPHPEPETIRLGLVYIDDYQVVVAKDQWKEGDLAVYIEPDTMVPVDREEFSFLKKKEGQAQHRVKVIKLRGCYSQGLLVPAPDDSKVGDDLWDHFGLERYEPTVHADTDGQSEKGPSLIAPKYDLENWRKFGKKLFEYGEEVVITEKIHGANARFVFDEGRMFCGTRTRWIVDAQNIWWECLRQNPWIEKICQMNPRQVLYGEVYGWVQNLRYGHEKGECSFAVFDILDGDSGIYLHAEDILEMQTIKDFQIVPVLYHGPYSREKVLECTDGASLACKNGRNHIREGCVVKPALEKITPFGRVALKSVSDKYLMKDKG